MDIEFGTHNIDTLNQIFKTDHSDHFIERANLGF